MVSVVMIVGFAAFLCCPRSCAGLTRLEVQFAASRGRMLR
jgi:hypothetical protein